MSFLHTPQPGKPTLLFDFIEEFRQAAVDRVVWSLLNREARLNITDAWSSRRRRGMLLARNILDRLRVDTRHRGERVSLEKVVELPHFGERSLRTYPVNRS